MAWNKRSPVQTPKPKSPSYLRWLSIIGLSLFFLISFLYLSSYNKLSSQQKWINILIALLPLALTSLSLLCCIFIYLKKKKQHDFLEQEKTYTDNQWEQWGARSMSVLESMILLPKKITIPYMIKHQAQHVSSYKIPQDIDYLLEENSTCFTLLRIVRDKISQLSTQHTLQIKYLTKKNENISKIELINAWGKLFPNNKLPEFTIIRSLHYDYIENAIKNNKNTIKLFLIEQEYTKEQSAALATFLITSDDIAKSYHLETIANIKRPMPISFDDNYQDVLKLFSEIQTDSTLATHSFSDGKCQQNLFNTLFQSDNKITNISTKTLLDLEFFIGPTGDYSPWLNMILAVLFVSQYQKTALVLSQEPSTMFIGTITPSQST